MYMNVHCSVPSPTMRIISTFESVVFKMKAYISNWVCFKLLTAYSV